MTLGVDLTPKRNFNTAEV